jgi:hypothetical protein
VLLAGVQEGLGGAKRLHRKFRRFQQPFHGDSIRFVVFDNGNHFVLPISSHTGTGSIRLPQNAIIDCDRVTDIYV